MIRDFLGKSIQVGDTLAFAYVNDRSAEIGLRKVVSLTGKNGETALMVVSRDNENQGRPREIYKVRNCIVLDSM